MKQIRWSDYARQSTAIGWWIRGFIYDHEGD
jgi:hypothetical protein